MKKAILLLILVAVFISVFIYLDLQGTQKTAQPVPPKTVLGTSTIGKQTKFSGCLVNGALQDSACTPGAVFPTATVNQICQPGYSKSVRNVPESEKEKVYEEYGITEHHAGEYEVDHLVSLELGGSNDLSNLWPEAANPKPGFHEKDAVENYLHDQVCIGKITLTEAQNEISSNWLTVYKQIFQ